jgi:HEPN domain-containing protein
MTPLDPAIILLVRQWVDKAEADLAAARHLASSAVENRGLREIVGFHCQQAAEKYVKALLTVVQVEFSKTHAIDKLLKLAETAVGPLETSIEDARWLTTFGVEIRYPGDLPEMLPGEELRALEIAADVKRVISPLLVPAGV